VLTLVACGDDVVPEPKSESAAVTEQDESLTALSWLKQTHAIAPEHWLASRAAGHDIDTGDPSVVGVRRVLEVAAMRFRDHPRMIANRAVQLEGMLQEQAIREQAPYLIALLSQVPGNTRYVESFSSLTQQYYNLRIKGLTRSQAVDALRQQNDGNY